MIDLSAYDTRPQSWLHSVATAEPAASFDALPLVINELANGSDEDLAEILPDADPNDLKAIGVWPTADWESGVTDLMVREVAAQLVARLHAAYPDAPPVVLAIRILYDAIVWPRANRRITRSANPGPRSVGEAVTVTHKDVQDFVRDWWRRDEREFAERGRESEETGAAGDRIRSRATAGYRGVGRQVRPAASSP